MTVGMKRWLTSEISLNPKRGKKRGSPVKEDLNNPRHPLNKNTAIFLNIIRTGKCNRFYM